MSFDLFRRSLCQCPRLCDERIREKSSIVVLDSVLWRFKGMDSALTRRFAL